MNMPFAPKAGNSDMELDCNPVSDTGHSALLYSMTAECAPVKEEPEWGACGVSEAAARAGLYAGHELKGELIFTPAMVQQQDIATLKQIGLLKLEDEPCSLLPGGWCGDSFEQQHGLRSCFVRLERLSLEHLHTCTTCHLTFDCSASLRNHSDIHSTETKQSKYHTQLKKQTGETFYSCNVCEKQFTHKSYVITHIRVHEPYCCCICNQNFERSNASTDTDNQQIDTEEKPYICYICQEQSENKPSLEHREFSCNICIKGFKTQAEVTNHVQTHTYEKLFSCDMCDKRFALQTQLNYHLQIHTGQKPYRCDVCNQRFELRRLLIKHVRNHINHNHVQTHTYEKLFSCDVCERRYARLSSLNKHLQTHKGNKTYSCDVCEQKYALQRQLNKHLQFHIGKRPYSCDVCAQWFTQPTKFISHLRAHTDKLYSCLLCMKIFMNKNDLIDHLQVHTGSKYYPCDSCTRQFSTKSGLIYHQRVVHVHSDVRLYSCRVCKKYFRHQNVLAVHLRSHTDEKKFSYVCAGPSSLQNNLNKRRRVHTVSQQIYSCRVCQKKFREKSDLVQHMKTHIMTLHYDKSQNALKCVVTHL